MTDNPLVLLAMLVLLALSASFSASETAFFSLEGSEEERASGRVRRLLREPQDLLITILLANLVVNLLFFVVAHRAFTAETSWLVHWLAPLFAILLLGEILPKTLAFKAPLFVANIAALPISFAMRPLAPARTLARGILEAAHRMLGGSHTEHDVTPEMLDEVLERSAEQGLLDSGEAELLGEIVELSSIRVREIMTPRVDLLALDLADPAAQGEVLREAHARRLSRLPVVDGSPDEVVGQVRVRDVLADPERKLQERVMPIHIVPEVASAIALLSTLREDRADLALVVDEWGGTAGLVTIEDVLEEIVGELRVEGEAREKPVVPLGEGHFRVAGSLSVREWNDVFGFGFVPNEFETVGGFVTAQLGRIPRSGDEVRLGALVIQVHEVRGRRVVSVDLHVEGERLEAT